MTQNLWQDFQIETSLFSNSIFSFWRFFSLPSSSSMRPELRISFQPAKTASKMVKTQDKSRFLGVPAGENLGVEESTFCSTGFILGKKIYPNDPQMEKFLYIHVFFWCFLHLSTFRSLPNVRTYIEGFI